MYIKLLGSIAVLLGFSFLGFYYAYREIFRKNDLLEMKRAIIALTSEINFLSSIDEAIINIEKNLDTPIKNIFMKFRENLIYERGEELSLIWDKSIEVCSKKTYFSKEDIDKLKVIGKVIGSFDREFNIEGLKIVIDYIDTSILQIDREKVKNMKMYQSLGVMSGLIVIILLI